MVDKDKQPTGMTTVVVPIRLQKHDSVTYTVQNPDPKIKVKASISLYPHAVELGFAVTFHKLQGRTVDRLILDINDRPFAPALTLAMLNVGISRVKSGDTLRRLPGFSCGKVFNLGPPIWLQLWHSGYDSAGIWRAANVLALSLY